MLKLCPNTKTLYIFTYIYLYIYIYLSLLFWWYFVVVYILHVHHIQLYLLDSQGLRVEALSWSFQNGCSLALTEWDMVRNTHGLVTDLFECVVIATVVNLIGGNLRFSIAASFRPNKKYSNCWQEASNHLHQHLSVPSRITQLMQIRQCLGPTWCILAWA